VKPTAVAEAMICAFSAIVEALPAHSQQRVVSILNAAIAAEAIGDADARAVLECLVCQTDGKRHSQAPVLH
jgi:hypothetical protein